MAKFTFEFSQEKVKYRPVNTLNKEPGDYDVVSLKSEIEEVVSRLQKGKIKTNKKSNKRQRYDEQPVVMDLPIEVLDVARSIQRPYSMTHAADIGLYKWDSWRPLLPIVTFNPLTEQYWIIEGNHTSIAQGIRAAMKQYPDVDLEDWSKLKIRCQVVILKPDEEGNVDMSFCRDHFLGTNGGDRLKLDDFDIYQNLVLKVRQDCYGNLDICDDNLAKKMFAIQETCEKYKLYPQHPRAGRNTKLPGAINHIKALMQMSVDDMDFTGKQHQKFWDNLVVDSIELLPMQKLRKLIDKNKSNPDEFQSKQHEAFMYEMATVMQKFGGTPEGFRAFAVQVWEEYYVRSQGALAVDKIPQPKADFSLVLWLKLHKKVGGKYSCIPNSIYTQQFVENGVDAVDCVPKSKQKIFKEFK